MSEKKKLNPTLFRVGLSVDMRVQVPAEFAAERGGYRYKFQYEGIQEDSYLVSMRRGFSGSNWGIARPVGGASSENISRIQCKRESVDNLPPTMNWSNVQPRDAAEDEDGNLFFWLPTTLKPPRGGGRARGPRVKGPRAAPKGQAARLALANATAAPAAQALLVSSPAAPQQRPEQGVGELVRLLNQHKRVSGDSLLLQLTDDNLLRAAEYYE